MSTYELDDEMVVAWLAGHHDGNLASALREQIPIPLPVKIGAVVKCGKFGDVFIRWAYDSHTHEPWIAENSVEKTYRNEDIGRIIEVLSPGVDL